MRNDKFEEVEKAFEEAREAIKKAFPSIQKAMYVSSLIEPETRNVRSDFWHEICKHYDRKKLLNCYGDVFYIEREEPVSSKENYYIGRRVLWGFGLSEERYEITEEHQYDMDGEFEHSDYTIDVLLQ